MASRGSYIRSAARATYSAPSRLPIRWRLAGGSALLTLVILCGFAAIVGAITTDRVREDFRERVAATSERLRAEISFELDAEGGRPGYQGPDLDAYASPDDAMVRIVTLDGEVLEQSSNAPDFGPPTFGVVQRRGFLVASRPLAIERLPGHVVLQYGRPLSQVDGTVRLVWSVLALGVLGGAGLALLAGLAVARRAMAPVAALTEAAREVERTRDPTARLPRPVADDEVAELARTLEAMLSALSDARAETEAALDRQRAFVADASHELRTPLTALLANLEMLAEELEGEQRETAGAALRGGWRMRQLVADLLLLARADAGRAPARALVDLADVVVEAASELEPVAGGRVLTVAAAPAPVRGARDELHRLVLNLVENALRHTEPGTSVRAEVGRRDGAVVLSVEDDGPGVPPELAPRIFDRFVRGARDRGGSTGLGLAIVRAVAESHGGTVALEPPNGRGARFVVRLPAAG